MWYERPDKLKWIIFALIVTAIGIIVCFKGMKMIDRYFDEKEKEQNNNLNTFDRPEVAKLRDSSGKENYDTRIFEKTGP